MLTRLEIDGFKTLEEFSLDLQPFMVIAGPNASGKSNLFDAIQLLSRLASGDLKTAVSGGRGEPHELFRRDQAGNFGRVLQLAAEVLVEPRVRDPWGQEQQLIHTRLRYELTIERRRDAHGLDRLYVTHEEARPIRASDDTWARRFRRSGSHFAHTYLHYHRRNKLLETTVQDGRPSFKIHQDGSAGRLRQAVAAEATVLSSMGSAEFRHLFALREEMRSWRFLQLDPVELRQDVQPQAPERLEPSGWNLAAVLARIKAETSSSEDPAGLLSDISADLASLIPGVTGLDVRQGSSKRWELQITTRAEAPYSGRVASDGTLRLLALLTALNDPMHGGVICFEEPENGVHPARIKPLIDHLRRLVSDPADHDDDMPLLQLLLTTHSPVVVSALRDGEGVFFETATVASADPEQGSRRTNPRLMQRAVQQTLDPDDIGHLVTSGEVEQYLATASPR